MKHLTVKELIEKLSALDKDILVDIEGCDCTGKVVGVSVIDNVVMIRREDGCYRYDEIELK